MTLFLGASPSYVREDGAKPNPSWRDRERRIVASTGKRACESRPLIVIGTQEKRAGLSARIWSRTNPSTIGESAPTIRHPTSTTPPP